MNGMRELTAEEYAELWMDAPIGKGVPDHLHPGSAEEAMRFPGCCVKSKERRNQNGSLSGMNMYFGKVSSYSDERVVVLSHEGPPGFVWEGTAEEYMGLWDCD